MEEMMSTPDGPGGSYTENRKAKGEGATADNCEVFRKRGKMISYRLVKKLWNEIGVDSYSKWILPSLKGQVPGSGRVGNSVFISWLSPCNKFLR
jgi:hypothetical protein